MAPEEIAARFLAHMYPEIFDEQFNREQKIVFGGPLGARSASQDNGGEDSGRRDTRSFRERRHGSGSPRPPRRNDFQPASKKPTKRPKQSNASGQAFLKKS